MIAGLSLSEERGTTGTPLESLLTEDKGEQQQKCHVHIVQVFIILELITLLIGIQFLLLVPVEEWNISH